MNDKKLKDLEKKVMFENGTEKPFENEYWKQRKEGIYLDKMSATPLFSSKDKLISSSGWPSFSKPISYDLLREIPDHSHNMLRIEVRSKDSKIHLGHVFKENAYDKTLWNYCINSASLTFLDQKDMGKLSDEQYLSLFLKNKEKSVFAGGCFWGMEALFSQENGVIDVVCGYCGGESFDASYERVKTGQTKHAEAVEVTFDKRKISYKQLLSFFFQIHDPTTPNRQGNDSGSQYRSVIFYLNNAQKKEAESFLKKANSSKIFLNPIVTTLQKCERFYLAESYHQDYLRKNPEGYHCHWVRKERKKSLNDLIFLF